jgi:PmbA protein
VPVDAGRLDQRIADAVLMAELVHNPPYALPEPATYPDVPLADPGLSTAADMSSAAQQFAEQLRDLVAAEQGVHLSAAELFLTYNEVELVTSRGVRAQATTTRVLAELAFLAGDRSKPMEEAEFFRPIEARRMKDLRLPQVVAETATHARDTLHAAPPQTRAGPVVLSGEALAPLFDAYTYQAAAGTAYNKLSRFEVGQSVYGDQSPAGDRLTLRANALRPYGFSSHRFDGDGIPGQDVPVIEDGVLRARPATQRYAQYLGIAATGAPGNTEVRAGEASLRELLADGPLYHVVTFSFPDVDPLTGDFGWEIRLGYEVTAQGARPIKGGSASGNIFDAFGDVRFSKEQIELRDYAGPLAARFGSLSVSGE